MLKCTACGGVYNPVQAGGFQYFHACAPVFDADQARYVDRPDKRDENITVTGATAKGAPIVAMKAEGKGAIDVGMLEGPAPDVPA